MAQIESERLEKVTELESLRSQNETMDPGAAALLESS